jgi:hypothetical protein
MGYSYFVGLADTIQPDAISAVVPSAWSDFQAALADVAARTERSIDALLAALGREEDHGDSQYDDDEEVCAAIATTLVPALDALQAAFEAATTGMTLGLGYVDSDALRGSDLYDETYWYIGNHKQSTPAYAAFEAVHGSAITKTWIMGG